MDFNIKSGSPEKQRSACVIVGIFSSRLLSHPAKIIDKASKQYLSTVIRRGDMDGNKGQYLLLHNIPGVIADRVLLIGCGKEREVNDRNYREIIGNSISALNKTHLADLKDVLYDKIKKLHEVRYPYNNFLY